jgi:hypothetical protein
MGNPLATDPDVLPKTQATRKGGKFKVSKEPLVAGTGESVSPSSVSAAAPLSTSSAPNGEVHAPNEKLVEFRESEQHSAGHSEPATKGQAVAQADRIQVETFGALPETYHHDSLFLTARDPRWLFSYWDLNWSRVPAHEMRDGRQAYYLRITRLSGEIETLVEIHPGARNWYVPVRDGGTVYVAELGYFDRRSAWHGLVRSGEAKTPADALAPECDGEAFASVPQGLTFEKLQELVQQHMAEGETLLEAIARITGEGRIQVRAGSVPTWSAEQKRLLAMLLGESLINVVGLGSEEIDRLLRKALQEKLHSEAASGLSAKLAAAFGPSTSSLFSPLGASWSAQPFGARERGFYMHLNAEVIFYGGTQPDATVKVNGETIKLQPDGSFRYHFTLPDGDFEIPIVAVSADGQEERSGTLSFQRQTRRVGAVGATAQPAHLEPLMGRRLA